MAEIPNEVKAVLDDTLRAELFNSAQVGESTYYIVDLIGDDDGEMVVIRVDRDGSAQVVDDIPDANLTSGGSATLSLEIKERLQAMRGESDTGVIEGSNIAGGGAPLSQKDLNTRLRKTAKQMVSDEFPKNAGGYPEQTKNGSLGCAWVVNQVAKKGLGKQIGGGLQTSEMVKVLSSRHHLSSTPLAGAVIISPSASVGVKWTIGHVGIVAALDENNIDNTVIYSNSSTHKKIMGHRTIGDWRSSYKDHKKLKMEYYQLEPSLFPEAANLA